MREGTRASLPSPPLLFIAFFTSHRSPLSERLEQATSPIFIHLFIYFILFLSGCDLLARTSLEPLMI